MSDCETPTKEKKYFVIKKTICPECDGKGHLPNGFPLHNEINNYTSSEVPCICSTCDGIGVIRVDVSFRDALKDTLQDLNCKF